MALIKEDYGLIYNDDGSLCVTVRDDDTPFQGVKSYAIEESTENLITEFDSYSIQGTTLVTKIDDNKNGHFLIEGISGDRFVWQGGNYTATTQTITGSYKFKIIEGNINDLGIYLFRQGTTGGVGQVLEQNIRKIDNKNIVTITFDGTGTQDVTVGLTISGTMKFEVWEPQMEQKPFATSFVDGSRPDGLLDIKGDKIGIDNGLLKNHIISFWFKVPKVQDGELFDSGNWSNVGEAYPIYTHDVVSGSNNYQNFQGNYALGIATRTGELLYYNRPDDGYSSIRVKLADRGSYENEWHNFIIAYFVENDYLQVKSYYDGTLIKESFQNLINYPTIRSENIYFYGYYMRSNLISNLFIGKYKDKNGNVIWTDEYIQEVYEAKKPFNTNM